MVTNRFGEVLTPHEAAVEMMDLLARRRAERNRISDRQILLEIDDTPEKIYKAYKYETKTRRIKKNGKR